MSGRPKPDADDAIAETQTRENGRDESWQGVPSKGAVSNETNARHIHKRFEHRRTGIRSTDRHASWLDVYRACHVGVGMNE